ncbi:hypothetical protein SEVIR_6G015066v4 [Setaria viridis]
MASLLASRCRMRKVRSAAVVSCAAIMRNMTLSTSSSSGRPSASMWVTTSSAGELSPKSPRASLALRSSMTPATARRPRRLAARHLRKAVKGRSSGITDMPLTSCWNSTDSSRQTASSAPLASPKMEVHMTSNVSDFMDGITATVPRPRHSTSRWH